MIVTISSLLAQTSPPDSPIARGWIMLLGLAIAAIVLTVGLLVLASLRRTRRSQAPTRTPYVDAWTESGKRATLEPRTRDNLDEGDDER
ncbi:MAG: hypothetical protein ACIAS6_14915 [Phycisphaerales bacterium JB060]